MSVRFRLNGNDVEAAEGESILQAARRFGVDIPHLCHKEGLRPDGNCRACVVEVKGERALAASCSRKPAPGMTVETESARARAARKTVLELLLADVADSRYVLDSELARWCDQLGVERGRFPAREPVAADLSHPAIAVNLDACIHCTRCLRACREEQGNDVIGYSWRGPESKITFDLGDPLAASTCVACGECVQACPTGALAPARGAALVAETTAVESVCPYCGIGCRLTYHVKDNRIVRVDGADGPANDGRLCVKGRYGFDYVHHRHRLTTPLIRRDDAPKSADFVMDPDHVDRVFREASWEEALQLAAGRLKDIRDSHGPQALAGFGSAKGSNEEAYLFQKLVRTGFRTNNVDHCTRLCHASSVAALLEGIGSGATSNPVRDVAEAEVIFVIGSNTCINHPVGATWIKNAARRGAKLIVADPRRPELARFATHYLQFKPDADVALLNAIAHAIVDEGLTNEEFIAGRTEGFDAFRANLAGYSPEAMAPVCGIAAEEIRTVARLYAKAKSAMIFWGMGISQHVHGTDNARCLIALALMTGQVGRPGTGLHPLRGQNNVQGASDAGLIPMMYPDYRRVDSPQARADFEALWGCELDPKPGLTVVEIMQAALKRDIRGMYVMGENPAMSDPDLEHTRAGLASLDWLVVQDIFLTETAYLADVVLPATAFPEKTGTFTNTDRVVQLGRQALTAPGDARQDWELIQEMARGIGLPWNYRDVAGVYAEMRRAMPSIAGISWERLQAESSATAPCRKEGDTGDAVVFTQAFPTASGKGRFVPAAVLPAAELPDEAYPTVLITGRQLEHWHTGAMTRRAGALDAIEPHPVASLHPRDLQALGVAAGAPVAVASRRGSIALYARADDAVPPGAVFIPFCYYEAAANLLTNPALDPFGKIPEFKYCAVRVSAGGDVTPASSYGGGQLLGQQQEDTLESR